MKLQEWFSASRLADSTTAIVSSSLSRYTFTSTVNVAFEPAPNKGDIPRMSQGGSCTCLIVRRQRCPIGVSPHLVRLVGGC